MITVPLIKAQLLPPRIKNYIRRTRLLDLGFSVLTHRITTVIAPAGYGKSVWLSYLVNEPGWPSTSWLSLDSHDKEPSFLLYHLIHAIKRVVPEFGSQSLRTLNSLVDTGQDWLIAVSSLIEEIPQEDELVLILDDVHLIDKNAVVCNILEYLIRWLPAEVHLVLISRNNLPLNLYREQLSGELLEVRSDKLLFSVEETRDLLMLFGLEPEEKDIDMIHNFTAGWAVELRLLGLHLKQLGGNIKENLLNIKHKNADLYSYLTKELLDYLPNELHNFLLDSSLLPYLEPELCNAALQHNDSCALLTQLHSLGILNQIEGETIIWHLHHLIGEYLEQQVLHLRPPDYIVSVRRRAATFLEHKGDIDRALEQVAACDDWATAATLIHDHGDKYFLQNGRLDALLSWISRLPKELVNVDCVLLYFMGMCLLHINPKEALETLSCASDTAGEKREIKYQLHSLLAMFIVYTFTNDLQQIKETTNRITEAALLCNDSWSRDVMLVAALGQAAWEGNLRQGIRLNCLIDKTRLDPVLRIGYLVFSFVIQFQLGNFFSAQELIEKLLADPYVQGNERWTGDTYTVYVVFCEIAGDHKKLAEICKELLRLGQKYNVPHQLGYAHRGLAKLHLLKGHLDQTRIEFEFSRNAFIQANNYFYSYLTNLDLILLRIKTGENAKDSLSEVQDVLDNLKAFPGGRGLDDYVQFWAGIISMETGQLELARQQFEELKLKCIDKGARQLLVNTQLLLAQLSLLQGDDGTADSYLREALCSAETEKWELFSDWHAETVYSLCHRALLKKIHPTWAVHLLQRWFPQRTCKEAGSLLIYPDENVRNCISVLLQSVVRETGVPIVHLNCLGGFRVFVNGVEIPQSLWKTKKAESLFKFLIIHKERHLKEKIIEELWPESEPRLGDASLRMALTHTRQALKLNDNTNESVILKRGTIYLNPEIEIYTDYELFTTIAQNALANTVADNPVILNLLEQASGLYQGNFLPDNLYDDWTINLRTQLRHLYLQILLKQIEAYRRLKKLAPAIQACRHYLALEPADESICREAMELLWQNRQKQQALSLYQELTKILLKEYEVTPTRETISLYEKIRCS